MFPFKNTLQRNITDHVGSSGKVVTHVRNALVSNHDRDNILSEGFVLIFSFLHSVSMLDSTYYRNFFLPLILHRNCEARHSSLALTLEPWLRIPLKA
jgi:hypothetical protein